MGKIVVIVLVLAGGYFVWDHVHEKRAIDACWKAGDLAGLNGRLTRDAYEGSEKATGAGMRAIVFNPKNWDMGGDGAAKAYLCAVDKSGQVLKVQPFVGGAANIEFPDK
jgi:hypothetical protein